MYRIIPKNRFIDKSENIDEEDIGLFDEHNMATHGMNRNLERDIPLFFDNLKVVQRRILYAMAEMGLRPSKNSKNSSNGMEKAAGVVGEVIKKYHPHGDASSWKALIYMRQPWRHLLPLIDTKGNYGNADNPDAHASMRYVEVRLSEFAWDCFFSEWDLKSNLVDMRLTFNQRDLEPIYLPAKYPLHLMSWGSGIGYGTATKSPGFLPQDAMNAVIKLLDDKDANIVLYPEDPLGCTILDKKVFKKFVDYDVSKKNTDKLKFRVRSNYRIDGNNIVITNTPFEVNPVTVVERIVNLVKDNKLDGIVDVETELKKGHIPELGGNGDMSEIWIEYKRGYDPHILMEKLYKITELETTFALNCVYVDMNKNVEYNLRDNILNWIKFRRKLLKRMYRIELNESSKRVYVLDALIMLFESNSIDAVIDIIRHNKRQQIAEMLIKRFDISDYQAKQISSMRIIDLSPDSHQEYIDERKKLNKEIDRLQSILKKKKNIDKIIKEQMEEGIKKYSRKRISKVIDSKKSDGEVTKHTICVTDTTYIKKLPENSEDLGLIADESKIIYLDHSVSSTDKLFMFTPQGRTYSEFVEKITASNKNGVGSYLRRKAKNDSITIAAAVSGGEKESKSTLMFVTQKGVVKQTQMDAYFISSQGSVGIRLASGDNLVDVQRIDSPKDKILIYTKNGNCGLFDSVDVTQTARTTVGLTGIRLDDGDEVEGMIVVKSSDTHVVTVSTRGEMKRFSLDASLGTMKRGANGVSLINSAEKLAHVTSVGPKDKTLSIVTNDKSEDIAIDSIPVKTRLSAGDKLFTIGRGNIIIKSIKG